MSFAARRATLTVAGVLAVAVAAAVLGWLVDRPRDRARPVGDRLTQTIERTYADAVDGRFVAEDLDPGRPWSRLFAFDALTPRRLMQRIAGTSGARLPDFVPEGRNALVFVGADATTYVELDRRRVSFQCLRGTGQAAMAPDTPLRAVPLGGEAQLAVAVADQASARTCLRALAGAGAR